MNNKKLKTLTLEKLVNAVYFSAKDSERVFLYLTNNNDSYGQTKATKSIGMNPKLSVEVKYQTATLNVSMLRNFLTVPEYMKLQIFDNLNYCTGRSASAIASIFVMAMNDGFPYGRDKNGNVTNITPKGSFILCSSYRDNFYHTVSQTGNLLDRMIVVSLKTSDETLRTYDLDVTKIKARDPVKSFVRDMKNNQLPIEIYNRLSVGQIYNLKIIQKYLTDDEIKELIAVIQNPYVYEL